MVYFPSFLRRNTSHLNSNICLLPTTLPADSLLNPAVTELPWKSTTQFTLLPNQN